MKNPFKFKKSFLSLGSLVFWKIFIVGLITSLLIIVSIFGFFRQDQNPKWDHFRSNLTKYAQYISDDLGVPPDFKKAQQIKTQLLINIRYSGKYDNWVSGNIPPLNEIINNSRLVFANFYNYKENFYYLHKNSSGNFLFSWDRHRFFGFSTKEILRLAGLLIIILVLSFYFISKIMSPLKDLKLAVVEVGLGNLNPKLKIKNKDEFSDLARAFLDMAKKIRGMIGSQKQLLLDISHELRSPITRMSLVLELMPSGKIKDELHYEVLEMKNMVSEILESARLDSEFGGLNLQEAQLSELVPEWLINYKEENKKIAIKSIGEFTINIDINRVQSVFNNILENALKYSSATLKKIIISGKIINKAENKYYQLTIEDFGKGIEEDQIRNLFEPFYRVDKSRDRGTGGYGLGLSLVKKIMEAHGGQVNISSKIGEGTLVQLLFIV